MQPAVQLNVQQVAQKAVQCGRLSPKDFFVSAPKRLGWKRRSLFQLTSLTVHISPGKVVILFISPEGTFWISDNVFFEVRCHSLQ
jgi:hypothetical protein